jgi:RNA polymerase sigma-70 factor (ECF subfamily)
MAAAPMAMTADDTKSEQDGRTDFHVLFRAHFRFVCVTLGRLGVRERDVEDVAQEVFVLVHRKLDEYDASRSIQLWLFGFCLRVASSYRRLARHRHVMQGDFDTEVAHEAPLPDARLAAEQNRRLLLAALDQVEEERRTVFVMHDLNDFSATQIAEMLSIPVNTVYSRLRLAREDLKKSVLRLRAARGER